MWLNIREDREIMINNFLEGLIYNIKGLTLGVKTWRLLLLGILRFIILVAFTIMLATLALKYHDILSGFVQIRPTSLS